MRIIAYKIKLFAIILYKIIILPPNKFIIFYQ